MQKNESMYFSPRVLRAHFQWDLTEKGLYRRVMDLVSHATVSNHMNDGILNILIRFADKAAQISGLKNWSHL